jgi:hypothetical protein
MVRLVEIAELLGVSKQRAHQIADEPDFPAPVGRDGRGAPVGSAGACGVGEALARREALALVRRQACYRGEDRSDLCSLKGSPLDEGPTDGLNPRSVRGHDRLGFS